MHEVRIGDGCEKRKKKEEKEISWDSLKKDGSRTRSTGTFLGAIRVFGIFVQRQQRVSTRKLGEQEPFRLRFLDTVRAQRNERARNSNDPAILLATELRVVRDFAATLASSTESA